jgi:hypothetical protein
VVRGIAREQLRVVKGKDTLFVSGDEDGHHHVGSRSITVNMTEADTPAPL